MVEFSMQWDGTTVGDAAQGAPYGQNQVNWWYQAGLVYDRTTQGVLRRDDSLWIVHATVDMDELLEVSNPAGYTIRVEEGGAIVDGALYINTAVIDFTTTDDDSAITAPGSGTNYYRVVLRKDWTAQTIRAAVLDVDTGAPAAVTQTNETLWEISLATVAITSAGVVTVTDTRVYCGPKISTSNLVDDAVTNAKIADDAVDTAQIADDAVDTDQIADDAVDDTKAGNRVARFTRRQGGSATVWAYTGSTTYTPTGVIMQGGTTQITITTGNSIAQATVTFPVAFGYAPLVFLTYTREGANPGGPYIIDEMHAPMVNATTGISVDIYVQHHGVVGSDLVVPVQWLAIGPEA
jgi:hypothetical protein